MPSLTNSHLHSHPSTVRLLCNAPALRPLNAHRLYDCGRARAFPCVRLRVNISFRGVFLLCVVGVLSMSVVSPCPFGCAHLHIFMPCVRLVVGNVLFLSMAFYDWRRCFDSASTSKCVVWHSAGITPTNIQYLMCAARRVWCVCAPCCPRTPVRTCVCLCLWLWVRVLLLVRLFARPPLLCFSVPGPLLFQSPKHPNTMAEVCRAFRNTGRCRHGDDCKYEHSEGEPIEPPPRGQCFNFEKVSTSAHQS